MAYKETDFDGMLNASRYLEAAAISLATTSLYTLYSHPMVEEVATAAKSTERLRKRVNKLIEKMRPESES